MNTDHGNTERGNTVGNSFSNGNGAGGAILAVLPPTHWAVLSGMTPYPYR